MTTAQALGMLGTLTEVFFSASHNGLLYRNVRGPGGHVWAMDVCGTYRALGSRVIVRFGRGPAPLAAVDQGCFLRHFPHGRHRGISGIGAPCTSSERLSALPLRSDGPPFHSHPVPRLS